MVVDYRRVPAGFVIFSDDTSRPILRETNNLGNAWYGDGLTKFWVSGNKGMYIGFISCFTNRIRNINSEKIT